MVQVQVHSIQHRWSLRGLYWYFVFGHEASAKPDQENKEKAFHTHSVLGKHDRSFDLVHL